MTGKTERVILIKGDATKWYNQAIFIVNQDTPPEKMPVNFVAEAEKIINNYMEREKRGTLPSAKSHSPAIAPAKPATHQAKSAKAKKKGSKTDFVLNMLMVLACVAIVAVFVYGMML